MHNIQALELTSIPLPQVQKYYHVQGPSSYDIYLPDFMGQSSQFTKASKNFGTEFSQVEKKQFFSYERKFVALLSWLHVADQLLYNQAKEKIVLFSRLYDRSGRNNLLQAFNGNTCFLSLDDIYNTNQLNNGSRFYTTNNLTQYVNRDTYAKIMHKYEKESAKSIQEFYVKKLRLECLDQLNQLLPESDISHEEYIQIGQDIDYLGMSEGIMRVYADFACLRGSYNFLRNLVRKQEVMRKETSSLLYQAQYRVHFGLDQYNKLRNQIAAQVSYNQRIKDCIEQHWYSYSKLKADFPHLVLSDLSYTKLCSLDRDIFKNSELYRLSLKYNMLHDVSVLPSELQTLDLRGNQFVELTAQNIYTISKTTMRYCRLDLPATVQNFPVNSLLFCKPMHITIDGNSAQSQAFKQHINPRWHSWVRRGIRYVSTVFVASLCLYGLYKILESWQAYEYACVAERAAARTSSIEQLIEQYGQTSVINAFGVAKCISYPLFQKSIR